MRMIYVYGIAYSSLQGTIGGDAAHGSRQGQARGKVDSVFVKACRRAPNGVWPSLWSCTCRLFLTSATGLTFVFVAVRAADVSLAR